MDDVELRRIVESVVRVVLERRAAATPSAPLVFLLTAAEDGHTSALQLIAQAQDFGPVEVVAGGCYIERYGLDDVRKVLRPGATLHAPLRASDRVALVRRMRALVFLLPLRATIAKAARGLADGAASQLLVDALAHGRPAFAAGGEIDPSRWPDAMPALMRRGPDSLGDWLERDLTALTAWGLVVRSQPEELFGLLRDLGKPATPTASAVMPPATMMPAPASAPGGRRFLTVADVRERHRDGARHLVLGPGDRLTDAAREEAARLSMTVE